jgi:hypothetical protein
VGDWKDSTITWSEYDVIKDETTGRLETEWCFTRFTGKLRITSKGCYIEGIAKASGLQYNASTQALKPGMCPDNKESYYKRNCTSDSQPTHRKPANLTPTTLLDSEVSVGDSLIINDPIVHISYRDGDAIDGDRVSLFLGSDVVLGRRLKLGKRYATLHAVVPGRVAYLILYADDAGKGGAEAEATTSLAIEWGKHRKRFELNPKRGRSKAIKLLLKE